MQMRCGMFLNDKAETLCGLDFGISTRLSGLREISFGAVFRKQLFDHAGTVHIRSYGTESSRSG